MALRSSTPVCGGTTARYSASPLRSAGWTRMGRKRCAFGRDVTAAFAQICTPGTVKLECGVTRYRSFLGTNMAHNCEVDARYPLRARDRLTYILAPARDGVIRTRDHARTSRAAVLGGHCSRRTAPLCHAIAPP
eukprot:1719058-Rhodomonas_salina.1